VALRRRQLRKPLLQVALVMVLAACSTTTPPPTGPRSTSVADDAASTCTPSTLGATTAEPVKPGPTSLGIPMLPEGDLPMGRYQFDMLISIDAPCWTRLLSPVAGTLALSRSDVPSDRLSIARARRAMVDPCDSAKVVDQDVASVADWFSTLHGLTVEERPSMQVDEQDATVLRLSATVAGACSPQIPDFDTGDAALFGLPFVETRDPGQVADVSIFRHPTSQIVTVIVATSADAAALDRFGPFVRRVLRSLHFDYPVP
jgi:hypothetical protein